MNGATRRKNRITIEVIICPGKEANQNETSDLLRDWSNSIGGVGRSREGVGHEVLSLVQGVGRAILSYPSGVGHPILLHR